MAKKPGLMNDPKNLGGSMLNVANVMAKAAHIKAQKTGKSYLDPDGDDSDNSDSQESSAVHYDNAKGKKGSQHPSAPAPKASQYSGEQNDEMCYGADHPSVNKPNRSRSQISAIKEKSKGNSNKS